VHVKTFLPSTNVTVVK